MPSIETNELTKRYGDTVVVDDLDLEVRAGEVFGFLGPNGAGKSTTIDMLLDFVRPTSGEVRVLGHDPRTESVAVRDRIGILPEGYALYDRRTARQHVAFAVELEDADDDPDAVLDRVGLADDADRPVGGFSKGMRQRLALGMALVDDPDLLVLDEPSAGLDPSGIRELRDIIRTEADRGATVFFSSHVLEQVEAVCDRVGILREGELATVDTIDNLRERAGGASTLSLTVDTVPESSVLEAVDGVRDVTVDGNTLRVACADPSVKAAVIAAVEDAGATVEDIDVEEMSLESVFETYTERTPSEVEA
ncbi:ABC transporter ATP-binding protein [Halorubellus litoreus]|uniref:ABC transporter ATP-binding protein n=1 Tax=Halorubellus litoreus TaxID=755308 RepID=A0ABD5VIK8_9EURY